MISVLESCLETTHKNEFSVPTPLQISDIKNLPVQPHPQWHQRCASWLIWEEGKREPGTWWRSTSKNYMNRNCNFICRFLSHGSLVPGLISSTSNDKRFKPMSALILNGPIERRKVFFLGKDTQEKRTTIKELNGTETSFLFSFSSVMSNNYFIEGKTSERYLLSSEKLN